MCLPSLLLFGMPLCPFIFLIITFPIPYPFVETQTAKDKLTHRRQNVLQRHSVAEEGLSQKEIQGHKGLEKFQTQIQDLQKL